MDGEVSRSRIKIVRVDGPFRQTWVDTEAESSHRLWDGFLGQASATRHALRRVGLHVLTGYVTELEPAALRCRGHAARAVPVLVYRPAPDIELQLSIDRISGLPTSAQIRGGNMSLSITDLKYTRYHGLMVPSRWQEDDAAFSFDRFSDDGGRQLAESNPNPRRVVGRVTLPFVKIRSNSASRGVIVTVNGRKLRMLLDTGAATTVVNTRYTRSLGLRPLVSTYSLTGLGWLKLKVARANDVVIGTQHLRDVPISLSSQTFGYDGMIGVALFSMGRVTFLPNAVRIEAVGPSTATPSLPIDTYDGYPLVTGRIGDQGAELLIDTGAPFEAFLPDRFAREGNAARNRDRNCQMGNAIWNRPSAYVIKNVRIGKSVISVNACVSSANEVVRGHSFGVLGYPLVKRLVKSVDYANGIVGLK